MEKRLFLTIDLEDWFQVENLKEAINPAEWDSCEMRVVDNVKILLELLERRSIKSTFFVLGWIAERIPKIIKEIHENGHEIASHGYAHKPIYAQSVKEFLDDLRKSKRILEDIIGEKVIGYRAPNFSITDWAIKVLKDEGFIYDSSYCPTSLNKNYGKINIRDAKEKNGVYILPNGLYEIPISTMKFFKIQIPTGGAYFRIIPYWVFKYKFKFLNEDPNDKIVVFYIHPWEIDPDQPKVKGISFMKKFRHYTNLKNNLNKFERLIGEFSFTSIGEYLKLKKFHMKYLPKSWAVSKV